MRSLKEEASTSTELLNHLARRADEALDLIAAVQGLHGLTSQQLSKLIRDSGNNILQHITEEGSHVQIDVEKFARNLPAHLISVVMAWEREKSTFKYLLCGILLLHSMCDLASRVPKVEQILLDDVKVSEQLIDLVFYLLIVLASDRQEHQVPNDMILLHSALVACSLKLLTVIISPQWQEVAQVLTAYYKIDVFMEAAFTAVCKDIKFLQTKLSAERAEPSRNISPTNEETLNHLCQQCESSLKFLHSLCQQKLLRERIVKNKELCGKGGILLLAQAVMNLKISPFYSETSPYMATTVSGLKSKALSILLHLCEAESVSYLDEVASNPGSQDMAKSIALQVLELLKKMFGIDSKQLTTSSEKTYPKGQLELNAMRLADIFSDDSNFRSFIMINFTEALASIFLLSHGEFLSGWCSSDLPVCEDDTTLDVPRASYAHQRTSLLIKVIANLHCYVPNVCQDEKDLFLNKFVRCLQKEPQKISDASSSILDAEKTVTVSKNLGSLLSHAESLIPGFLNEDDVQLLRLFISQFKSSFAPGASEDNRIQEVQNTEMCPSPLLTKIAPDYNNRNINVKEGILENNDFQEASRLEVISNGNDESIDVERKSGRTEQGKPTGGASEIERDTQNFETSGSDSSSTRGKNSVDRMDVDHIKESSFVESQEDEKVETMHSDEKQQRKRKRTVMNDKQIALIENALVDEPDMHRNSTSLRLWADKLTLHGAEVTTSRLKNWLNNRKAKLARAAKDGRVPSEGDNLDRQGGSGVTLHFESPHCRPMEDVYFPSATKGSREIEITDTASRASINKNFGASISPIDLIQSDFVHFEPGQYVTLVGEKAEEVGKGKVFQVRGKWYGKDLEGSGMCVVDVIELVIDRFAKVLHPLEVTGTTFDQAEKSLGCMRVLWDTNKLFPLPLPARLKLQPQGQGGLTPPSKSRSGLASVLGVLFGAAKSA
ncbi:sequence-specific DNA binding [Forsythia ovata]|uniref:Sequence-specific DNA binding n=1 Tax=Forsythia ovata TaxID=205694 RepID=A0ABD1VE20_9LAMI